MRLERLREKTCDVLFLKRRVVLCYDMPLKRTKFAKRFSYLFNLKSVLFVKTIVFICNCCLKGIIADKISHSKIMNRVEEIKRKFSSESLPIVREIDTGRGKAALLYHPDLTDSELVFRIVEWAENTKLKVCTLDEIRKKCIFIPETQVFGKQEEAITAILGGDAILIFDGVSGYLSLNVRKYDKRSISEPPLATVTHGPREGFIEDLKTNLGLLERRVMNERLVIKKLKVGDITNTDVAVVYIDGIANKDLVDKTVKRIKEIKTDGILDVQYLEPYLEEKPYSIFNQTGRAEKPDIVASKILEGRIAVFVNGTPMVLTLPYLFMESLQSSADYYQRFTYSSFLRVLRFIILMFAILLPGVYIALQKYHFDILPLKFMLTVMTALNGIPFRATAEMLFVILLFEIIRETGIRMPQAVGMAMSIVGALVLGDTAVKAGIVSSPSVMIVALSSLALYTAPDEVGSTTLLRIIFTILGGIGGLYFLLIGTLYLIQYLVGINGNAAPYLAPYAPDVKGDRRDGLIRSNYFDMRGLPHSYPTAKGDLNEN